MTRKFTVLVQQYVERVASIEVEAEDEQAARWKAADLYDTADWSDGDDAYSVECYAVFDEDDNPVWER